MVVLRNKSDEHPDKNGKVGQGHSLGLLEFPKHYEYGGEERAASHPSCITHSNRNRDKARRNRLLEFHGEGRFVRALTTFRGLNADLIRSQRAVLISTTFLYYCSASSKSEKIYQNS